MAGDIFPENISLPREFVPDELEKFTCHHCGMVSQRDREAQIIPEVPEQSSRSLADPSSRHDSVRERVKSTLTLYREIIRELKLEKTRADKEGISIRRIDLYAAREVKKRIGYVHGTAPFIGDVPGVEAGDQFNYRMELSIVGLHRPLQGGIDYMGSHQDVLATSIVASRGYADDLTNPDELVYLGQGGTLSRNRRDEDQNLTRGNLALVNNMKRNTPVRVIRKDIGHTFTYDGLYAVDRYQKIPGPNGKMVFEFLLKRLPSQPEILQNKKMKAIELSE